MVLRRINIKRIPIVRIYGGDWSRVAEELDDMLNIGNLAREFSRNYYNFAMSDPRLSDPASPAARKENPGAVNDPADDAPAAEPEALPVSGEAK